MSNTAVPSLDIGKLAMLLVPSLGISKLAILLVGT
jgi:hypothetical protein